jgi:hypothetical protein
MGVKGLHQLYKTKVGQWLYSEDDVLDIIGDSVVWVDVLGTFFHLFLNQTYAEVFLRVRLPNVAVTLSIIGMDSCLSESRLYRPERQSNHLGC